MSRGEIKRRLKKHLVRAERIAEETRGARARGDLDEGVLASLLRAYILAKYRLTDEEAEGVFDLEELAQLSLDKTLAEAPELAAKETMSATCDGADSTTTKYALLMVAIQRDFEVKFNGFEVAFAQTVDDLAHIIWSSYQKG